MYYDVAAKVILSRCKEAVLSVLCGLSITSASLIETRPQETTSLRRSDFVLRASFEDGSQRLVLLEFLSFWRSWIPIRTLECRCRHLLEETLPVVSVLLLLTPSSQATDSYLDDEVHYRFRLVKIYELEAQRILQEGPECLFPFIPLMKGGDKLLEAAENRIYDGDYTREEKADLLTGMAILGGLVSREIPLKLLQRRRDIMIESAAYELIKKEGFEEGLKQGLQQGIQQGIQQGLVEEAKEMVLEALEERFGLIPPSLVSKIKGIQQRETLKSLHRAAIRVKSLDEFKALLEKLDSLD